jgi:hypothetical protein
MDNSELRGLLADLAKDDPRPRLAGVLEIRAANFLREHGARLLADSEAYAKLRAEIAGAQVVTIIPHDEVGEDLPVILPPEPFAVGQRVALLPVGEGE